MGTERNYYTVLGVGKDATDADIQRAYRRLAKRYHPDVSKEPNAEARFKELQSAYDVLKDQEKRELYDRFGPRWKAVMDGRAAPTGAASSDADGRDLDSLFEQVFGTYRRRRRHSSQPRGPTPPPDQETELELSVLEAYKGGAREVGWTDVPTGQRRRLTVRIPAGIRDGQKIRLSGQGSGGGDLFLRVVVAESDGFRLEGSDVYVTLPVTPPEAVLGTTASVNTLDGSVRVKVPPGSGGGRVIRLRERGFPNRGGDRGDLYAEVEVVVPPSPSPEERALYERLLRLSTFDPRRERSS